VVSDVDPWVSTDGRDSREGEEKLALSLEPNNRFIPPFATESAVLFETRESCEDEKSFTALLGMAAPLIGEVSTTELIDAFP